ncbi:MAG: hypothetical protein HOK97_11585 [Deltaproteobacteria bacterium]|jgi:cytochrome c peroxidase|nr:hypothetical protein [Deltaproteobacteria bacterium]
MNKSLTFAAFCLLTISCASGDLDSQWPVDPDTGLRMSFVEPVPPLPQWESNPSNQDKEDLGRFLFWDGRISGSKTAVCGNCHLSMTLFQSSTPLDVPDRSYPELGPSLHRNAPALMNIIYAPMMRWDGSHYNENESSEYNLFEMMALPYAEANMNLSQLPASEGERVDITGAQGVMYEKLTEEIPGYVESFEKAFGEDIRELSIEETWHRVGQALATFMRVAVSRDSAFDRWNAGEDGAITDAAIRGADIFSGKAGCSMCHFGAFLSDFQFHNVSTSPPAADGARHDEGRFLVTGKELDAGKFLTPMLRGVGQTSPYFHDGSETSLYEVIRQKTTKRVLLDPLHSPVLANLPELSDEDIDDMVQFLKSLDGSPLPIEKLAPLVREDLPQ